MADHAINAGLGGQAAGAEFFLFGWLIDHGVGIESNLIFAADLYKIAADKGVSDAQYNLVIEQKS